jgi:hypothetical protein
MLICWCNKVFFFPEIETTKDQNNGNVQFIHEVIASNKELNFQPRETHVLFDSTGRCQYFHGDLCEEVKEKKEPS